MCLGAMGCEISSSEVGEAKKWAGIYHSPEGELVELQNRVWSLYNCSNTLYEGVFPSIRKFEAELISWLLHLLHGPSACGLLTSGGTESVMLAALSYRELRHERGIERPRVLAASTCHPCIVKACHYFGMALTSLLRIESDSKVIQKDSKGFQRLVPRKIRVDASSGYALTARAVKPHLTPDVVCIYASAPSFPHGVIDHVEDLGALALAKNVGLHVDNCLGGVLLSYLDASTLKTP